MALLTDTNILLDWILKRQPFHQNATNIIELCMHGKIQGYLAAHTVLNIFYITRKDFDLEERRDLSRLLCYRFEIIGIDRRLMIEALDTFDFNDLEDGLQAKCAIEKNLDYIITRDMDGFKDSDVKAILPEDFLTLWSHIKE